MYFKDSIIEIGKQIYGRVYSYVLVNKDDDDKKYNYAFINLNDGRTIKVPFTPVTCDLFINDDNGTFYIVKNSRFGFLVNFSFNDKLQYQATEIDFRKRELTTEEENIMWTYMNDLLELTNSLSYDKTRTQSLDNLNPSEKRAKNIMDYYDEINASLETHPESITIQSVETAVNWWTSRLIQPFTEKELNSFKNALILKIMQELSNGNLAYLDTEYAPKGIMREAMEESRIDETSIPKGIRMVVGATYAVLRGEEAEVLYSREDGPIRELK